MFEEVIASYDASRFLSHTVALLVAYVLALPIGWDREKEERSAGIRTFPLVAISSCGFIMAADVLAKDHPEAMARVIEGVITGMGFIGGGAILRMKTSVRGTATAASLWATGALGVAVGLRAFDIAALISLFTFVTLKALKPLKIEAPDNEAIGRDSPDR